MGPNTDNKQPPFSGKMDSPVFLLGAPRSGTSLAYCVLLVSGQFPLYKAETHLLDVCKPLYGDISVPGNRDKLLENWVVSQQFQRSGLDKAEFLNDANRHFSNYGAFLELFMERVARKQGKTRWLEKTPEHIFEVRSLIEWFPDARFLHVIRDGRDVALSLRNKGWVSSRSDDALQQLISAARLWHRAMEFGNWLRKEGGNQYMEFRYEDLVGRDEGLLDRINHFIGIDLDYDRIDTHGAGALRGGNTTYEQSMVGLSKKGVCRWDREMSVVEKQVITYCLKETLEEKGYRTDVPQPAPLFRLKSGLLWWGNGLSIPAKYWLRHHTFMGRYSARRLDI